MAKTRQDRHDPTEWYLDWVVTGEHVTDYPGAPFRDYHSILFDERAFYPGPPPNAWGIIVVYDREKAEHCAQLLHHNPDVLMDMCLWCHYPYYSLKTPRWGTITPPQRPPVYITWPDLHRAHVPACISWDSNWTWDEYPPYPWP